jgi:uncharacterized membrane protein
MANIQKEIEIGVPVRTAYNQWTQFEEFPRFMEGVEEVRQLDDRRLHWVAEIAGKREEWDATITEQTPDQVIAWESVDGARNAGRVSFEPVGGERTRIRFSMEYEPDDIIETVGDKLGFVSRRVEGDLKRFEKFIESRGVETGAWRGEIA